MSRIIFNFYSFLFFPVSKPRAKSRIEVFKNRANRKVLNANHLRARGAPKSLRLRGLTGLRFELD